MINQVFLNDLDISAVAGGLAFSKENIKKWFSKENIRVGYEIWAGVVISVVLIWNVSVGINAASEFNSKTYNITGDVNDMCETMLLVSTVCLPLLLKKSGVALGHWLAPIENY